MRIALVWDCRGESESHNSKVSSEGFQYFAPRVAESVKPPSKLESITKALEKWPNFYIMNSGELVGEAGIMSQSGWRRKGIHLIGAIPFQVDAARWEKGRIPCYCDGIGKEIIYYKWARYNTRLLDLFGSLIEFGCI